MACAGRRPAVGGLRRLEPSGTRAPATAASTKRQKTSGALSSSNQAPDLSEADQSRPDNPTSMKAEETAEEHAKEKAEEPPAGLPPGWKRVTDFGKLKGFAGTVEPVHASA